MSKGAQIAIAVVSAFVGVALLVSYGSSGEGTFRYYENVSAFLQTTPSDASTRTRSSRVHGFVVEGSIAKDIPNGHVDFAIHDPQLAMARLPVRLLALDIPDLFKDGAEVVVEGRFEKGLFLANRVMAKCPSKYEVAPGTEV